MSYYFVRKINLSETHLTNPGFLNLADIHELRYVGITALNRVAYMDVHIFMTHNQTMFALWLVASFNWLLAFIVIARLEVQRSHWSLDCCALEKTL